MKEGYKTTEFWGTVGMHLLTILSLFFPDAGIDPNFAYTLSGVVQTIYTISRAIVKRKAIDLETTKATLAAKGLMAVPKVVLIAALSALLMGAGCGPKQPISEGTIYVALEGTSAGYGFAHEAITKFSAIMAEQIRLSCPSDPSGPLCKAGKAYQKLYTESLYPASVEATAAWDKMMEAFDIYRNLESPTQSDADDVIKKIEKVKALISKLKELFAGIKTTSGPISFEGTEMLDYTSRMLKYSEFQAQQIELEVQQ